MEEPGWSDSQDQGRSSGLVVLLSPSRTRPGLCLQVDLCLQVQELHSQMVRLQPFLLTGPAPPPSAMRGRVDILLVTPLPPPPDPLLTFPHPALCPGKVSDGPTDGCLDLRQWREMGTRRRLMSGIYSLAPGQVTGVFPNQGRQLG